MTDRTFDPNTWLDAYRETFASVHKSQEEGFKAIERFARFQYAVAGDCLPCLLSFPRVQLALCVCRGSGRQNAQALQPPTKDARCM